MGKPKILLVDDSNTVLMMERMVLNRSAYEFIVAHDGQEAVEVALEKSPDLILMDVMMPRMDGFTAVRRLREAEATRHIPVIMVTTRGETESIEKGFESGCNDYITKPIDTIELESKIRNLLGDQGRGARQ